MQTPPGCRKPAGAGALAAHERQGLRKGVQARVERDCEGVHADMLTSEQSVGACGPGKPIAAPGDAQLFTYAV